MGDPYHCPFSKKPGEEEAQSFFKSLILSASGWRAVFARDEESMEEELEPAKAYTVARMALVFARWLKTRLDRTPALALAMDTRPTGTTIAHLMARVFLAEGIRVQFAFIAAAPEIMAWTREKNRLPSEHPEHLDTFAYISASHNPVGHNGLKFGLGDGGVLPAASVQELILEFKKDYGKAADIEQIFEKCRSVSGKEVSALFASTSTAKRHALSSYTLFTHRVLANSDDLQTQRMELEKLANAIEKKPAGIVIDMNGSARSLSIDCDFFESLGLKLRVINEAPRAFAHRIVPEGESLNACRLELERAFKEDPVFTIGYVPDCDGDRGNMVIIDRSTGRARPLEAQENFALALVAELSALAIKGGPEQKLAAVGNDATSMRAEAICQQLGVAFFRAETGEANIVALARELRDEGYTVRVLGEGSNGGLITHPAAVRDPINTVTAILRLISIEDDANAPFLHWLKASESRSSYKKGFSLEDVLESLPVWTTTAVFEKRAALKISCTDHIKLKKHYQKQFLDAWPELEKTLEPAFGETAWRALASLGSEELAVSEDFGRSERGGLRIVFSDSAGRDRAFIWMRGSGTEPVFRIMADIEGDNRELEACLLDFHTRLVHAADSDACCHEAC